MDLAHCLRRSSLRMPQIITSAATLETANLPVICRSRFKQGLFCMARRPDRLAAECLDLELVLKGPRPSTLR